MSLKPFLQSGVQFILSVIRGAMTYVLLESGMYLLLPRSPLFRVNLARASAQWSGERPDPWFTCLPASANVLLPRGSTPARSHFYSHRDSELQPTAGLASFYRRIYSREHVRIQLRWCTRTSHVILPQEPNRESQAALCQPIAGYTKRQWPCKV